MDMIVYYNIWHYHITQFLPNQITNEWTGILQIVKTFVSFAT